MTEDQELSRSDRRDFLYIATGAVAAVGAAALTIPLMDSFNPTQGIVAVSTLDVDLAPIAPGQRITVMWRSKPVFVVHRTETEIARATADDSNPGLLDPATDASRVVRAEWLVAIGICTHLGCVPVGQRVGDRRAAYGGWFCACHGSVYDTSGRVRRGPAPRNLDLPPYTFLDDTRIRIG